MMRWLGAQDRGHWSSIRAVGLRLNPNAFQMTLDDFLAESDASAVAKLAEGQVLARFTGDTVVASALCPTPP